MIIDRISPAVSISFEDLTCLHRPQYQIQLITIHFDVASKPQELLLNFKILFLVEGGLDESITPTSAKHLITCLSRIA